MSAHEWAERLREEYRAVIRAQYQVQARLARFNALEMDAYADLCIAPGDKLDVHGDGTVKAASDCTAMARAK